MRRRTTRTPGTPSSAKSTVPEPFPRSPCPTGSRRDPSQTKGGSRPWSGRTPGSVGCPSLRTVHHLLVSGLLDPRCRRGPCGLCLNGPVVPRWDQPWTGPGCEWLCRVRTEATGPGSTATGPGCPCLCPLGVVGGAGTVGGGVSTGPATPRPPTPEACDLGVPFVYYHIGPRGSRTRCRGGVRVRPLLGSL